MAAKKRRAYFEGMPTVKVKLPISRNEKEDVFVAVNGKTFQIKRGVEVEIPECVYEVLQHKEEMLIKAMEYEAQAVGKAEDEALN